MNLTVNRKWKKEEYTIGNMMVDSLWFSNTLEDAVRTGAKIHGRTAIPAGKYKVRMDTVSPRFKNRAWAKPYGGIVPRLVDVPGFEGVLIHPLNTADETDGCIGVGLNKQKGKILDSVKTYRTLMDFHLIPAAKRGEEIWIEIIN